MSSCAGECDACQAAAARLDAIGAELSPEYVPYYEARLAEKYKK